MDDLLKQLLNEIKSARYRIADDILDTPILPSPPLEECTGGTVSLKMESEQYTGSFKARGSLNKLSWMREKNNNRFPVTASTGNHGLGFARALKLLDMEGQIYLPENAVRSKVDAIRRYGVEIEFYGDNPYDTEIYAREMAEKHGWTYVSPYNDLQVIAGQGTLGMEILENQPAPDAILATVGGGGLISGIGAWVKKHSPSTRIIGCQPEHSPEMSKSVEAGEYREVESKPTLSDGSAGGFEKDAITFNLCRKLVDDFILVSEDEIKEAIRFCIARHHKLVEGAAAVAVAAFQNEKERFREQNVVIVICGANISPDTLSDILCES